MGPMPNSYGPGMRGPPPNSNLGPGGPMPPMGMSGGPRQWQPNTSTVCDDCDEILINEMKIFCSLLQPMSYSSSSPGNYGVSSTPLTRFSSVTILTFDDERNEKLNFLLLFLGATCVEWTTRTWNTNNAISARYSFWQFFLTFQQYSPSLFSVIDSSNSGGENMYTLMKTVPSGNMGGVSVTKKFASKVKRNIIHSISVILGISNGWWSRWTNGTNGT